jgi:hypothetical protein
MRAQLISICIGVVLLACTHTTPDSATAPRDELPAASVQPMKLRYHGEHRGDHPSWVYTAHVSVAAELYSGRPAWRRTYRFETVSPPASGPETTIEGTIVLDRETLAPLEAQSTFGTQHSQLIFRSDRVDGTEIAGNGEPSHTTLPVQGFVVTDVWMGLDLYILGLPLKQGFQQRISILDENNKPLRPFHLSVERLERVHVPAGELDAFRILVDPLDGDQRMRSIYHVRAERPPVVLRKEYVVNPRTDGPVKRSTGVEELEAIDP